MRVAVIVNDMSEINIDASFLQTRGERDPDVRLSKTEEKLVDMPNGCICCTLREDLLQEVSKLAREGRFDYLLIESTGISEPLQVAETFTFEDDEGLSLSQYARLDTMLTVVDAFNFLKNLHSLETLKEGREKASDEDDRTIVSLLLDQVEFANVILLNKVDLVAEEEALRIESTLRMLNPQAKILRTLRSNVPLKEVLHTNLFDMATAEASPGWLQELRGSHVPETVEYGITSFVFRSRRPFHPDRFYALLNPEERGLPNLLKAVVRAKGFVWLATRDDFVAEFEVTGALNYLDGVDLWYCEQDEAEWDLPADQIKKDFVPHLGDRV